MFTTLQKKPSLGNQPLKVFYQYHYPTAGVLKTVPSVYTLLMNTVNLSPSPYTRKYRPFKKTLPRSSAFVNWISVRFYETGCSWENCWQEININDNNNTFNSLFVMRPASTRSEVFGNSFRMT